MSDRDKQKEKEKKKKQQEDWLMDQIMAIMQKTLTTCLNNAIDDVFSVFK